MDPATNLFTCTGSSYTWIWLYVKPADGLFLTFISVVSALEFNIVTFQCTMEFCNKILWNDIRVASHSHICPERNYNDQLRLQCFSFSPICMASPSKLLLFHHDLQEQDTDTGTKDTFHWSRGYETYHWLYGRFIINELSVFMTYIDYS